MEIRLPSRQDVVEDDEYSEILSPYPKLYLICDRGLGDHIPALDMEGRAVCFTDSRNASDYVQKVKDAESYAVDPTSLIRLVLDWRYLGIEKFLLFTDKGSFTEYSRAELLGYREKSWLNARYNHLRIRLIQARKYASAAKGNKKFAAADVNYDEVVRLLEYEFHSCINSELLVLIAVKYSKDECDIKPYTINPSWSASAILAGKFGIYRDMHNHIYGGSRLNPPYTDAMPDQFNIILMTKKVDGKEVLTLPAFTDCAQLDGMFHNCDYCVRIITFADLVGHCRTILSADKDVSLVINPHFLSLPLKPDAAESILGIGVDTDIPKHIRENSGKHTRINITGGKNNGCNS
ncbi:hypothetical protein SAMN02910447_02532 [Ruminococcus sp. YE71]|uniref:hypothetical protein n=1 Tax=unclassified Ruminococcus TaxID=2608920 RepID=UPI000888CA5A|nr:MULTISPECIES: hypothetical protein [unclassified Ruminococcus]SDA24479.1 hypothetical protein SAMN02910446_02399 [Ruminococcus sp. YE78]SFW42088.1 hypothetical protein SAMN02910447_02532 [Ruminococcus sp. YE71]